MKVWIFGDSFGAADTFGDEHHKTSWPNRLCKNHDVKNFAVSGSGPDYQLELLFEQINKTNTNELKDTHVIFLMSHTCRKNFNFYTAPEDQCFTNLIAQDRPGDWPEYANKIKKYDEYKDFIKKFYKHYKIDDFINNVVLLKEYAQFFHSLLVIPVFESVKDHQLYKKFGYMISNNDNFFLCNGKPLLDAVNGDKNKEQPNHTTPEVHRQIFDQLNSWLENKNSIFNTDNLG